MDKVKNMIVDTDSNQRTKKNENKSIESEIKKNKCTENQAIYVLLIMVMNGEIKEILT